MSSTNPSFYQWETTSFRITTKDPTKLVGYDKIVVSLHQGPVAGGVRVHKIIDSSDIDTGSGIIIVNLSQTDTSKFVAGTATLQVNIYYTGGDRDPSEQIKVDVYDNLYKQVMS